MPAAKEKDEAYSQDDSNAAGLESTPSQLV